MPQIVLVEKECFGTPVKTTDTLDERRQAPLNVAVTVEVGSPLNEDGTRVVVCPHFSGGDCTALGKKPST